MQANVSGAAPMHASMFARIFTPQCRNAFDVRLHAHISYMHWKMKHLCYFMF